MGDTDPGLRLQEPVGSWAPRPNISHSSLKAFDACPRAWLLRYAPERLPPELRRSTRAECRLSPSETLAGKVVDAAITEGLRGWHATGARPRSFVEDAERILGAMLRYSRDWAAAVHTGRRLPQGPWQPLEADYRGEGWPDAMLYDVRKRIRTCLRRFEDGPIPDTLEGFAFDAWHLPPVRGRPWFRWEGIPVYAAYDFAVCSADGVLLFDWKAGDPRYRAGVPRQMHLYAAYATVEWRVPAAHIRLLPVWLQSGEIETLTVSEEALRELLAAVRERYKTLLATLEEARRRDPLEVFPLARDRSACRRCVFRSCAGYRSAAAAPQTSRGVPFRRLYRS